jgi:hypothetical protein
VNWGGWCKGEEKTWFRVANLKGLWYDNSNERGRRKGRLKRNLCENAKPLLDLEKKSCE